MQPVVGDEELKPDGDEEQRELDVAACLLCEEVADDDVLRGEQADAEPEDGLARRVLIRGVAPVAAGGLHGSVERVEGGEPDGRSEVDVVLEEPPAPGVPLDEDLAFGQLRDDLEEHERHGDAAGEGKPSATWDPFEELQADRGGVDDGERCGRGQRRPRQVHDARGTTRTTTAEATYAT